jgi:hypothetical protein
MANNKNYKKQAPQDSGFWFKFKSFLKALLALGLIFAFFQIPSDPSIKGVWNITVAKSEQLGSWIRTVGGNLQNGRLDLGLELNQPEIVDLNINLDPNDYNFNGDNFNPNKVSEAAEGINTSSYNADAPYDRYEWRHWDNYERSCWNVREEVLWRDAVKDETLTLLDINKVRTDDKSKACYITGGTWVDPYTGEEFTNPSDLDVDHMIPLGYAARAGGYLWDDNKKMDYANYLDYNYHLVAVSASANRSKSDNGPADWKPRKEFYCQYGVAWTVITNKWELSLDNGDKKAIQGMLEAC